MRDGRDGNVSVGNEVGEARDDATGGLPADAAQRLFEGGSLRADDQLGRRHHVLCTAVGRRQMTLHVRITDDREDSNLRHRGRK